jgi:hypothetical protein
MTSTFPSYSLEESVENHHLFLRENNYEVCVSRYRLVG